MSDFIADLPKAELHIHIEGSLEPELLFRCATRNGLDLPFQNVDQVRAAYRFTDLQSFLDIYYRAADVLRTPEDFYELMTAYLDRAAADGVRHAEIFFDPQSHTSRGVGFEVFMDGFTGAIAEARRRLGMSAELIMCFLRHLSGEEAMATLRQAEPFLDGLIGVGLDSTERDRPAVLFEEVFSAARRLGLHTVAHAGEEGPADYVRDALDILGAERIDHGVRCLEDPELVARLARDQVPLTVCPLSNVALKVVNRLADHPLPIMIESGLLVCINSDDPAYFGGYVADNYREVSNVFDLGDTAMAGLAENSIRASFLDETAKQDLLEDLRMVSARNEG